MSNSLAERAKTAVYKNEADIAPKLLDEVWKAFAEAMEDSKVLSELRNKQKLSQVDVHKYAEELGKLFSKSYRTVLTEDALPNGKLYRNIAERIIQPTMHTAHESVTDLAVSVQKTLDAENGLGISSTIPEYPEARVAGIIQKASDPLAAYPDQIKWLDEPIVNVAESIVDDFVRENAEIRADMGLKTTITRVVAPGCCEWCNKLGGVYEYGDEPKDVYKRHQYCRCVVTFQSGRTSQNVWTKKTWESSSDEINRRYDRLGRVKASKSERKAALELAERDHAVNDLAKIMRVDRKRASKYAKDMTVKEIEKDVRKRRRTLGL